MKEQFNNTVKVEWLQDPRKMKLLETVVFCDKFGRKWIAPAGSVIDGASIPKFFWRVIGSPFIGKYRRASVIHDVYCQNKERPSKEVHACFKEMMVADGVKGFKLFSMSNSVRMFGPKF